MKAENSRTKPKRSAIPWKASPKCLIEALSDLTLESNFVYKFYLHRKVFFYTLEETIEN